MAVVANPLYNSLASIRAFDRVEGMNGVRNWLYLTGSKAQLQSIWDAYGIEAEVAPAGAMVAHTELAYIIDPRSHMRDVLNADPGQGTPTLQSSFAGIVANKLQNALADG